MRSTAINLGLVGALAVSLTACGGTPKAAQQRCIDDFDQVVPDAQCLTNPNANATPGTGRRTGSSGYRPYYGGIVSNGRVSGGSYTSPSSGGGNASGSSGVKTGGTDTGGFGAGKSSTDGGKSSGSSSSGSSSSSGGS